MEKEFPATGIKIIKLFIGLAIIVWIGIAILGTQRAFQILPIYIEAQSVEGWDVPPDTEVEMFLTRGFSRVFEWCHSACPVRASIYISSSLDITDIENFYQHHYGEQSTGHISIVSHYSYVYSDKTIYIVNVVWLL